MAMEGMGHGEADGLPSFVLGLQILLVDHDTLSLMHTASLLQQYSFKVTTTALASVALSMIRDQKDHYNLVMANLNMPDMDSFAFLRVVLKKEIPVVFMSSGMNVNVARKALAEGACFVLEKPISLEDLKNVWQHMYQKIRDPMNAAHKPNCGKDCQGIEIYEAGDVLRPPLGGTNKSKEVGGVLRPATVHDFDGIEPEHTVTYLNGKNKQVDIQNTCTSAQVCIGDHVDHERELECYCIEALVDSQRAFGMKRPIDDKEEQEEGKKTRIDVEHTISESINVTEEGMENNYGINGSSSDKKSRVVWTTELHLKFTAALSTLGDQRARPKAILKMMNVPDLTVRQVASHLQKYKNQIQKIWEAGTASLPPLSQPSSFNNRNGFPAAKQSSLVGQYEQGTSSFGVRGNTLQFDTPSSLTRSPISMAGFDDRRQNLYSGHTDLSHYTNLRTDSSNEGCLRTHGQFQNLNQIRETSSFMYGAGMNEILKRNQPLGLEESRFEVSQEPHYMTPEAASPYISANTFQLPYESPSMNQEQYYTPPLTFTGSFSSQNQNKFSTEVRGTTGVLDELMPQQIALGNATTLDKFPAYFTDGSQKLPNESPAMSQEQYYTPASNFTGLINSQNQNQISTEVLELVPAQIASGNATNPYKFRADFVNGSQMLDTTVGETPPASSSNKNQPPSDFDTDLLKFIEEIPDDFSRFGIPTNAGDGDCYCGWLRKIGNGTDTL